MTTFRWINKQGVESDTGFVVQRTGRFTEEYREAGRTLVIDVEGGFAGAEYVISYSRSSFASWSNDPKEQERVINNYRAALAFMGSVADEE